MNSWSEINNVSIEDSDLSNETIEDYSEKTIEGDNILPSSERFLFAKNKIKKRKINFFYGFVFISLLLLIAKTYQLQILENNYYSDLSENNKIRNIEIKSQRGIIYDSNMNKLVNNTPIYYLYCTPYDLPRDEQKISSLKSILKEILDLDYPTLDKIKFAKSYQKIFLTEIYDLDKITKIKLNIEDISGLNIEPYFRREYITNGEDSISNIIGYVGKMTDKEIKENPDYKLNDNIGKTGLELYYESELKGESGREQIKVNNVGKKIETIEREDQKSGNNLKLFINYDFQKKVENILKAALDKNKLTSGSVVVLNPQNGAVLASVSLPSYNSNDFSFKNSDKINDYLNNENTPLFNKTISGKYSPASTFKLIMSAAGLEEKIINENTTINDTGEIKIKNQYNNNIYYSYKGWEASGLGHVNIYDALAQSSDIYFYYLGGGYENFKGLGIEKMIEYFKKYKLDQKTNIDLPYEASGFIPTPKWKEETKNEPWTLGNTYHISIGQGDLLLTPIQIATYTSYFANNGISYSPRIVNEILDSSNNLIKKTEKETYLSEVVSKKTSTIIRNAMRLCVTSKKGTCKSLNELNITAAGKTGTAEVAGQELSNALFTGFAPFNNPEIVVTVLIENGGEGSTVALPVAKEIFKEYFKK